MNTLSILSVLGVFVGLLSCVHKPISERSFEEGNICSSKGGTQRPLEFIFSIYLRPPAGISIGDVHKYNEDVKNNEKILLREWVPALLGFFNGEWHDIPLSRKRLEGDHAVVILSNHPPYYLVQCSSVTACSGKTDPIRKDVIKITDYNWIDPIPGSPIWGVNSHRVDEVPEAVHFFKQYSGFFPGKTFENVYFAHPRSKHRRGLSLIDSIRKSSNLFLQETLAKFQTTSEKVEGDWKIISLKFDPTELCKNARPRSQLVTQ